MTESRKPMVSVVMKVYNGERFLREAIDSVLAQTYTDFELVIIDDGSTDSSAAIIQSYQDSRIRFLQNEKNLGLCATQNKVIAEAKGKYIAVMDCDDISYPERLMEQVTFLENHPEVMMCGTFRNDIVDGQERLFCKPVHLDNETLQFSLVFGNFFFTHSSIMFRGEEYRKSNLSYGAVSIAEDYQIITEMARRYPVAMIPKCLVGYRIDMQSVSHTKEREITRAAQRVKISYLETLPIDAKAKELLIGYFDSGIATSSVKDFVDAMEVVADYMKAETKKGGNAYGVACDILREYILRLEKYDRKVWRQLRTCAYREVVNLKGIFGWRVLAMCILGYRRENYAR